MEKEIKAQHNAVSGAKNVMYGNNDKSGVTTASGGINTAVPTTAAPTQQYKTPDDVKKAYQAGTITREQAKSILQSQHGMK